MERKEIAYIDPDPRVGLTDEQVRIRVEGGWENRTTKTDLPSEKQILLRHVCTFFNLIFLVLALILVLVRSSVTNFGFLGVVVLNLAIGIIQQIRAKRAVEKLTLVARQTVKTVRNGSFVELPSDELVRDDIVQFAAGQQICADGVVREGVLQVNESLITGEADPVEKLPGDELMSGSFVVAGSAHVQLTRVGDDSYAAKLSNEAKRDPKAAKGQMMRSLDVLIRVLGALILPLGVLYFISATGQAVSSQEAAEQTVAAMVSLIPQGLYLVTSVAMAVSTLKLSRKKVLVQDMNCIETLARVDVLCVDKTGTITESAMEVEELIPLTEIEPEFLEQLLAALYTTDLPENETARALLAQYGGDTEWVCLRRIPFTSRYKWSGAVFENQGAFLTGAPDIVLGERYNEVVQTVRQWSGRGRRVLLVAGFEGELTAGQVDADRVTPLALIVLGSRVREEAPDTFRFFHSQGVTVKVISGDDPVTVSQVARRAGIEGAENFVDCSELEDEQLAEAVEANTVFGRVTPEQKRELVKALQKNGHTVAMTGDGVNDVLAMRKADCAVAVTGGAQAAVQVAQLVLVNGDFAGLPQIFNEGRRVINNIGRAAALFLVKNIFTLALVLTALLSTLVYPFQPVHLTVVIALTVGIPSFFFALEPNYERFCGSFLGGAIRQALPAGLAAFGAIVATQLIAPHWGVEGLRLSTVCALALAAVGLAVLLHISRPLTKLRLGVIITMAVLLLGAFLLPTDLLGMDLYHWQTALLAVLACGIALGLLWLFRWLAHKIGKKER